MGGGILLREDERWLFGGFPQQTLSQLAGAAFFHQFGPERLQFFFGLVRVGFDLPQAYRRT